MARRTKQDQINELERTLKIEQDGLRAEKANLSRINSDWEIKFTNLVRQRDQYREKSEFAERLLRIVETLSSRKP